MRGWDRKISNDSHTHNCARVICSFHDASVARTRNTLKWRLSHQMNW